MHFVQKWGGYSRPSLPASAGPADDLSNATITVLSSRKQAYKVLYGQTGDMNGVKAKEVKTGKKVIGDIVRIDQTRPHLDLPICEVEVYGKRGM